MQWSRPTRKKNNEVRKQFLQWAVPAKNRREIGLEDGTVCSVAIQMGSYAVPEKEYMLTSGGEIRLPKTIANALESRAEKAPSDEVVFNLTVALPKKESDILIEARNEAVTERAYDPKNKEDARERIAAVIVRRQGQPEFRRKLMKAY